MTYPNGGDRNQVRLVVYDVIANIPVAGIAGRLFIATDTDSIYWDTGAAWNLIAGGGATARVPRTLFAHAHSDGNNVFPPQLNLLNAETFLLLPDNWNGTDKLVVWLLGGEGVATTFDFRLDAGGCDELFNVHTQTTNNKAVTVVNNEYECVDLTADLSTVIAALSPSDMLWLWVHCDDDVVIYCVGLELQET